ncbi:hypothetical protein [Sphingorhabdus sp.]|uniref:hypothetical protein n=1 Tax=Sphingorhabdus sp. TaxID=1902408 RepID=UPI002FDB3123
MNKLSEQVTKAALEALALQWRAAVEENEELRLALRFIRTNGLKNLEHEQLLAVFGESSKAILKSLNDDCKRQSLGGNP